MVILTEISFPCDWSTSVLIVMSWTFPFPGPAASPFLLDGDGYLSCVISLIGLYSSLLLADQ